MSRCGFAVVLLSLAACVYSQTSTQNIGDRIHPDPTYFISVPNRIRPGQIVQISVTIMKLLYPHLNVRISVVSVDSGSGNTELAFVQHRFERESTQVLQLQIPPTASTKNKYQVRAEGTLNGGVSGYVFEDVSDITLDAKRMSVFIQPSRPFYKQGETVHFRVIPLTQDLMSAAGSMAVYVDDATGYTVRRWPAQQTNAGVLTMSFRISDQPRFGAWTIRVEAQGYSYKETIYVEEYWTPMFEVNVTMPVKIFDNDFGLQGVIVANHTSGKPARGSGEIKLEIKRLVIPPDTTTTTGTDPNTIETQRREESTKTVVRKIRYFSGVTNFLFTMDELQTLENNLANTEITVHATIHDWDTRWEVSGQATTVVYGSGTVVKWLGSTQQTFKPGLLFTAYVSITNEDGSPIPASVRQELTIEAYEYLSPGGDSINSEKRYPVPDNGVVKYQFSPDIRANRIEFRAYYGRSTAEWKTMMAYKYLNYYEEESFVQITTETDNPRVNEYMVFTVRTNHFVDTLQYLVTAAGNIIMSDQLQMSYKQKTWSIAVSRQMSPSAHMLVYYIKDTGDIIADALNFHVDVSSMMNVQVEFNRGKDFTRRTAQMSAIGEPAAYVAFNAIYYDLFSRGAKPFLTEEKLMREMYTYDSHTTTSYIHTYQLPEEETKLLIFPSNDQGYDTLQTFNNIGLIVFTDSSFKSPSKESDLAACKDQFRCRNGKECYTDTQKCNEHPDCSDESDEAGCKTVEKKPTDYARPALLRFKHTERTYDSNTWAWKDQIIKANNRVDMTVDVPEYPLDWVVSAFTVHPYTGFSMLPTPYRFQPTRRFYMTVEYPDTMKQGEMLGIRIGVYNYWHQYIDCLVTLHASEDLDFIHVEEGGRVSQFSPRVSRADRHTLVTLLPGRTRYVHMPVVSTHTVGRKCVKISASTFIGGDEEVVCINIVPYGVQNYYGTPYFVDLSSQGAMIVPRLNITIPELFIKPEQPFFEYVPYSPQATVAVYGDVVGSYFDTTPLDTENTLRLPDGGADMTLYNLGINIYTMFYLQRTNQLSDDQQFLAFDYLNLALQRVLSYLNLEDGSFKFFRDDLHSSVWLTATAGKVLYAARSGSDWEKYFFVDVNILNRLADWLCDQQYPDGSFSEVEAGVVYDTKFQDSLNVSLTAYVLITLNSMTNVIQGPVSSKVTIALQEAENYLAGTIDQISDPFQACIVSYALHDRNNVDKNVIFKVMDKLQRTRDDMIYWADYPIDANRITYVAARPYAEPRLYQSNEGYAVMATAYAFLTYIERNDMGSLTTIIKWFAEMRNYVNGFSSTADTLVAIEALSSFARIDQNHDTYNLIFSITNSDNTDWRVRRQMDKSNIGAIQRVPLPVPHGFSEVVAQGTGYGLAHLATTVNVERPQQLVQPLLRPTPEGKTDEPYWDVYLGRSGRPDQFLIHFSGFNQSIMEADVCARWLRTDIKNRSGLAVIELGLPTGYVAWNTQLRKMIYDQRENTSNTLSHAEYKNNKVYLYYEYIENDTPTCTRVRAIRWYPIANVSDSNELRVYDFFEPGLYTSTVYNTRNLFLLDICLVCGSFECPYCPYYNSSPLTTPTSLLLMSVCLFVVMFITHRSNRYRDIS